MPPPAPSPCFAAYFSSVTTSDFNKSFHLCKAVILRG
jgi:hypothetical protein